MAASARKAAASQRHNPPFALPTVSDVDPCDFEDHVLTPSGGGHAPTPDRGGTPAAGPMLKRVDHRRPFTEEGFAQVPAAVRDRETPPGAPRRRQLRALSRRSLAESSLVVPVRAGAPAVEGAGRRGGAAEVG